MKTTLSSIILSFVLTAPFGALADPYTMTVPPGEYRLVAGSISLNGPSSFPLLFLYHGSGFDPYFYDPDVGRWSPYKPSIAPGEGVVIRADPSGGTATFVFPEPTQSPVLPLNLRPGFNAVCCQSNVPATFEDIVGRAPDQNTRLYQFNADPGRNATHLAPPDYTIYTFTNGVWFPAVPSVAIAEAVFIYQPPQLANPRVVAGKFAVDVMTPPSTTVTIEYADALSPTNSWLVLTEIAGDGTVKQVTDGTSVDAAGQRFYRARVTP